MIRLKNTWRCVSVHEIPWVMCFLSFCKSCTYILVKMWVRSEWMTKTLIRIIIFKIIVMSILFCNTRLNVVSGEKGSICQNSQRGKGKVDYLFSVDCRNATAFKNRSLLTNVCSYSCQLIFRSRPSQVFGTKQRLIKTTHNSKHAWLMTWWTKTNYSWKCHTFPNLFNILFCPALNRQTHHQNCINHVCGFW